MALLASSRCSYNVYITDCPSDCAPKIAFNMLRLSRGSKTRTWSGTKLGISITIVAPQPDDPSLVRSHTQQFLAKQRRTDLKPLTGVHMY